MPTIPPGLPYGTVTGRMLFVSADAADANLDPSYTVINGTVKFICSASPLKVISQSLTVVPLVFEASFDSEGYLVPVGDTENRGLKLPATDSSVYNPTGFTWRVEFNIQDTKGNEIYIAPFNFAVPNGTTVDLSSVIPIATSTGTAITMGPAGPAGATGATGAPGATGSPGAMPVFVVTGDEARPSVALVFWIGGDAQPTNMGVNDIWFAPPGAVTDTTPPTVPTNLVSSNVTDTSFTLAWTASTDNQGVTGYDVFLDGILKASVLTNTANITGLTAETLYSVTVKAKDAAGNISAASTALPVTTGAATGTPHHSIWGATFPYTSVKNTEAEPLTVANSFYSYGTTPNMDAWRVIGARIWVPAEVTMTQGCTVSLWHGQATLLDATPNNTVAMGVPVSGQWNEVFFPVPTEQTTADVIWIGYRFANGDYLSATGMTTEFITSLDGSHIVMSENIVPRSRYKYDSGSTFSAVPNITYSIDIIYDEGPV